VSVRLSDTTSLRRRRIRGKKAHHGSTTHEQSRRQRVPEGAAFRGYAVRGFVASEHVSRQVDAVWHFNPDRPDFTIDRVPWEYLLTPVAWIDLSAAPPQTHVTHQMVQEALELAKVTLRPGMTLIYYTGVPSSGPISRSSI